MPTKESIVFVVLVMLSLTTTSYIIDSRENLQSVVDKKLAVKCWINNSYVDVSDAVISLDPELGWELDILINNSIELSARTFIKNCYSVAIDNN